MDRFIEPEREMSGTEPLSSAQGTNIQAVLERLSRWQDVIQERLQTQQTLLEGLEEYLLLHLRTYYREGRIDPHFIGMLINTVLQRMIDRKPVTYDAERDAPYRWPGGPDTGFSAEQREAVAQAIEAADANFSLHFKDQLRRHWAMTTGDASLGRWVRQRIEEHLAAIDSVFQSAQEEGADSEEVIARIVDLEDAWLQGGQLTALTTPRERQAIEAALRSQLPDWLRVLTEPDRVTLQGFQEQTSQAQARLDELLDGLGSLQAFARQLAKEFAQRELDMEIEPDTIQMQLQWRYLTGQPTQTCSLSAQLAAGPVMADAVSVISVVDNDIARNQPLSRPFLSRLMLEVDAPAGYRQALVRLYKRLELKDAMYDWFMARMQQSALVARYAGHLGSARYNQVKALLELGASASLPNALNVAGLELPNRLPCAELLLFYREDAEGEARDVVLYAPGKPDGQEWVELTSLRAVSIELGGWVESEVGREYLLQQISPTDHANARTYLAGVVDKPTSWDLNADLRGVATGLKTCLEDVVEMSLANRLAQVDLNESPRWYGALPLDYRQLLSSSGQEVRVYQQKFNETLAGYEVFLDFAKRTVAQDIAPYMRSKGVRGAVDPATVMIEFTPGALDSRKMQVASLLDLAIYGYSDSAGIDNPRRGVRSSVGQDLSAVRSADLARYVRRAYVGEKYAKEIRSKFLDARDQAYSVRRDAYRYMMLARMERDLRVAKGKSAMSDQAFSALLSLIRLIYVPMSVMRSEYAESAVDQQGVIKFSVGGHLVLGVYVFVYFDPKPSYWLYTPGAPDGTLFRPYRTFSGGIVTSLEDYLLARIALRARPAARRLLTALAAGTRGVDTLREFNRLSDIRDEFDAYIERAVTDVEDITTSRAEVIETAILKGVLIAGVIASAVLSVAFPPFALLLDVVFVAVGSKQAIEAHLEGDTEGALLRWLEASWGALFAVLGAGAAATLLGRVAASLRLAVKPVALSTQRLSHAPSLIGKQARPGTQPIRLKPRQAVGKTPENLRLVMDEGIFHGTYYSPPSATQPRGTYYIRSGRRYFQVKQDPYFGGVCLIDSSRPGALYKMPIRRMADGKWTPNKVGLRGGSDDVRYLGHVDDLRSAFPDHRIPVSTRGALQGEAVVARFSEAAADNYLFSLNAQSCVIASLYNPTTKAGAVIHFDHNIRRLIDRSVADVLQRMGGAVQDVRTTLVGGDWLTTAADIGGPIRSVMRARGLQPTWDYWSFSSCFGSTYGVSLDLRSGLTRVFKTTQTRTSDYYRNRSIFHDTSMGPRAAAFRSRVKNIEVLVEDAHGVVRNHRGVPANNAEIQLHAFRTEDLT